MPDIRRFLGDDHTHCDELFARAEACVDRQDWETAGTTFVEFGASLNRHLDMEENVLFPAFEQAAGAPSGPTSVMRAEHLQIRQIMASASDALALRNATDFLAAADTLRILMGQHNMKEESMLYPMADHFLASRRNDIIAKMREAGGASGART